MTGHDNHITQGQYSFLRDLTDEQIFARIKYALENSWVIKIEYTDDPSPQNIYWEMFGLPMLDFNDPGGTMMEINECRRTFPDHYIRVTAISFSRGRGTHRMSFIVNQPKGQQDDR